MLELLAWTVGFVGSMSSPTYSLEEAITVNKARQPWVRFSADHVRCFCNLPQCVSTGYMCKSGDGGCFSSFADDVDRRSRDYRGRHGCLELLANRDVESLCDPSNKKSVVFCCYHDMCNHVDSPQTKDLLNNTFEAPPANIANLQQPADYSNSQVWFRAATIAVPVCGAVILFVLIALAIKILRSENQNVATHKLGASHYEHRLPSQSKYGCDNILRRPQDGDDLKRVQVPLLIQNEIGGTQHSGSKNETNAKLNLMQDAHPVVLDIEKVAPKCSRANLISDNAKYAHIKYSNQK